MQRKSQKTAALLLALAVILSLLSGCAVRSDSAVRETISSALDALEKPEPPVADNVHADVDYADMHWYIYDTTEFRVKAKRLSAARDGGEAAELYEWLMTEYTKAYTLDSLAYIDFYSHPGDEAISDACRTLDSITNEMADTICTAVADALEGPAGDAFAAYLGEDRAAAFTGYDEQTGREQEISERVSELVLQYNALVMKSLSFTEETEQIGGLYRELVDLRNEEAELAGYESYADYAYEINYGRDFTPDDAAALCEALKPYAQRYFTSLYTNEATYANFTVNTCYSAQELVALIERFMPRLSPKAAEAAAYMREHGLYYMDSRYRISDLGFTMTLDSYNAPFIYLALCGNSYDIDSMFHEFGHYYDAYVNPMPDLLLSIGSYDIFEIHSTGMEALSTGWYDDIYGEEADLARIRFLDSALYTVFTGCMFDEFQRLVYADPTLTPEQISRTYMSVARSYGMPSYSKDMAHEWMLVSHNFESPFYYISYAVSMLASLQIYEMAENDWAQAADFYNDLVSLGAFDYTYCDLLREVGLACFTDGLPACVPQAMDDLETLCYAWEAAA